MRLLHRACWHLCLPCPALPCLTPTCLHACACPGRLLPRHLCDPHLCPACLHACVRGPGGRSPGTSVSRADALSSADSEATIHSYEVRLVLEYCDKGSLREALDQDAFMLCKYCQAHAASAAKRAQGRLPLACSLPACPCRHCTPCCCVEVIGRCQPAC